MQFPQRESDDPTTPSPSVPARRSVCETHDPTGEPGAGNWHAGFGERGTGNAAMGVGLRPSAKAMALPPNPKAGAPAPDSTGESPADAILSLASSSYPAGMRGDLVTWKPGSKSPGRLAGT